MTLKTKKDVRNTTRTQNLIIKTTPLYRIVAEILHVNHLVTPNCRWKCSDYRVRRWWAN